MDMLYTRWGVLIVFAAFALVMWLVTTLIKKVRGKPVDFSTVHRQNDDQEKPAATGAAEKYMNGKKLNSRWQMANYFLIHDKNERRARGQDDDR